jgi:hypothetical protein
MGRPNAEIRRMEKVEDPLDFKVSFQFKRPLGELREHFNRQPSSTVLSFLAFPNHQIVIADVTHNSLRSQNGIGRKMTIEGNIQRKNGKLYITILPRAKIAEIYSVPQGSHADFESAIKTSIERTITETFK